MSSLPATSASVILAKTKKAKTKKAKTKKAPLNLSLNTNPQIDRLNIFYEYIHNNMLYHDEQNPKYKVTDTMLHEYINVNKLTEFWIPILKENRDLLYIDQFINFYLTYHNALKDKKTTRNLFNNKLSILNYFKPDTKNNYVLPVLNATNEQVKTLDITPIDILSTYKINILDKLDRVVLKVIEPLKCNINNNGDSIGIIISHGMPLANYCIVPEDVIIALVTPTNHYSYQEKDTHTTLLSLLKDYRNNQHFLKNPACYFRNNQCLAKTVYFYPGQLIQNYSFATTPGEDADNDGFYTIDEINRRDDIFQDDYTHTYKQVFLHELFDKKYNTIKNKIIYISCCKKYDTDFKPNVVEFMYRYEHIITYLNMSKCLAFDKFDNKDKHKCRYDKGLDFVYALKDNTKNTASNKIYSTKHLFYDSALSYEFNVNNDKFKKYKYMLNDYSEIPKFKEDNIKKILNEILRNLLKKYSSATPDTKEQISNYLLSILRENVILISSTYAEEIYNELIKNIDTQQLVKFVAILSKQNYKVFDMYIDKIDKDVIKNMSDEFIYELISINITRIFEILLAYKISLNEIYNIYKKYFTNKIKESHPSSNNITKSLYTELINLYTNKKTNITGDAKLNLLINLAAEFINDRNNASKNSKININNNKSKFECKQYYDIPDYINNYYELLLRYPNNSIIINGIFTMDDYQRIKCMPLLVIKIIAHIFTYSTPMFENGIVADLFKILLNPDNHINTSSNSYQTEFRILNADKPEVFKDNPEGLKLINPNVLD